MTDGANHKFQTLDAMRGVAAAIVVLFHFRQMLFCSAHSLIDGWSGYLAVDLFFALSGFVIAFAYDDRLARGMTFFDFGKRRTIRLLPMIWIGVAIGTVSLLLSSKLDVKTIAVIAAGNAFLIPTPFTESGNFFPSNGAQWSLFYEILINLFFALFWHRLTRRNIIILMACAALGLAVCAFLYWRLQEGWNFSRLHLGVCRVVFSFFAGVLLCRTKSLWINRLPLMPAWAVLSLTALALVIPVPAPIRPLYDLGFIIVASPMLIMLGASVEPVNGLPIAEWAGTLSFPVYAFHQPVRDLARDFSALSGTSPAIVAVIVIVGQRWLGKSEQAAKWSFCLKAVSMAAEQEIR